MSTDDFTGVREYGSGCDIRIRPVDLYAGGRATCSRWVVESLCYVEGGENVLIDLLDLLRHVKRHHPDLLKHPSLDR